MLAKKKEGAVLENSNVLVAVILAIVITSSIVIFSGMDTPERAQLANFMQQVSNVSSAVIDQLTSVSVEYAVEGESRNTEQVYYTLYLLAVLVDSNIFPHLYLKKQETHQWCSHL